MSFRGIYDAVAAISPWNTQIQIENQSSTPVTVWLARNSEVPSAEDAVEHTVPANNTYAISSGWYHEPRATLLVRTGVDTAKVARLPHASRLVVQLRPHGLALDSPDDVEFEDFPDPGAVPGHDTIPMVLRHESFHDRLPAAEAPRESVAREAAREVAQVAEVAAPAPAPAEAVAPSQSQAMPTPAPTPEAAAPGQGQGQASEM